jgi:hypothetical protein
VDQLILPPTDGAVDTTIDDDDEEEEEEQQPCLDTRYL